MKCRKGWGRKLAIGVLGLVVLGMAQEAFGAEKHPQPKTQELLRAEKIVQEVFGRDIQQAKTPKQKADLAREILKAAREEPDPALRFAALQTAKRLAIEAQDGRLGLEIVREIVDRFQPLENIPPQDRLAEAERLWQKSLTLKGQPRLTKQLEASENYIILLPSLSGFDKAKIEKRLEELLLSGHCRLQNHFSGLVLGVRESQLHPGADVIQWDTPEKALDSWWQIEKDGDYVRFRNMNSGLYLGVKKLQPGGQLCQQPAQDKSTYWMAEFQGETIKLKNAASGLYIDGPWKGRGYLPILASPQDASSQQWVLIP